ncbi:MAG: hypothetical protein PUD60_07135 [Akkermansia muciniphila]|nr:hypothetical protein [Akkermansia muciniphila]
MFSVTCLFRQLLAGCACLSCLSVAAAQEKLAQKEFPVVHLVRNDMDHSGPNSPSFVIPMHGIYYHPYIFAAEGCDYILFFVPHQGCNDYLLSLKSKNVTMLHPGANEELGGSRSPFDMDHPMAGLDIDHVVMNKEAFALCTYNLRASIYRADGKFLGEFDTPGETPTVDESEHEALGSLTYALLCKKPCPLLKNCYSDDEEPIFEMLRMDADGLQIQEQEFPATWRTEKKIDETVLACSHHYSTENGQKSAVFLWLCGQLPPPSNNAEAGDEPEEGEEVQLKWIALFYEFGQDVDKGGYKWLCTGSAEIPFTTTLAAREDFLGEEVLTPQLMGDHPVLLTKDSLAAKEYTLVSPKGEKRCVFPSESYLFFFRHKIRHQFLIVDTALRDVKSKPTNRNNASIYMIPASKIPLSGSKE